MKKLYIHIGHPKCGSSTIQDFLAHNWKAIKAQKLGIVDHNMKIFGALSDKRPPVHYFAEVKRNLRDGDDIARDLKALANHSSLSRLDGLILSAENLADTLLAPFFTSAVEYFDIQVIYYIRRQDDWLLSAWKQWKLKQGIPLERMIEKHCSTEQGSYKRVIQAWTKVVPRDKIYVNMLNRSALYKSDLLLDFCRQTGLEIDQLEITKNSNTSFNFDLLNTLAKIPFVFDTAHDNRLFNMLEQEFGEELVGKGENPLTYKQRRAIMAAHEKENTWLAKKIFPDSPFKRWIAVRKNRAVTEKNDLKGVTQIAGINLKLLMDIRHRLENK